MIVEFSYVTLIVGAIFVGLWLSNILYDLKVPHYLSRKIGHAVGGMGLLICAFLFTSGWWPLGLTIGFTALLGTARVFKPDTFRGVGGTGRPKEVMAEVWFPLSGIIVVAIGWVWLEKPLLAVACFLFMAWGDCVTGIVRSQVYGKPVKGFWGSVAMLAVCLIISWAFVQPLWLGVVASLMATVTEWACGDVGIIRWLDDNLAIPVVSSATIFGILAFLGVL